VERLVTELLATSDSVHGVGAQVERNHDVRPLRKAAMAAGRAGIHKPTGRIFRRLPQGHGLHSAGTVPFDGVHASVPGAEVVGRHARLASRQLSPSATCTSRARG
jgi:hypothetical protein